MVAGHFINGDYNAIHDEGVQDRVKGIHDDLKKREIDQWMAAPDTSLNYKAARDRHQQGTGSWLIECPDFKRWKDVPDFVLWLRGGPGCGKTILCSSAIENIKNSCRGKPSVGYAYFFFDGTSTQSKLANHESFVRSTIMQFSDQVDGIPPALGDLYDSEHQGRSQPLLKSLEDTLLEILQSFSAAYIVIDALDECEERPKVLKWIQSVSSRMSGILHLMVTSRPEPDIKNRLRAFSNMLETDVADRRGSDDIRCYIDACLYEVDDWSESQKQMIRIALVNGADGVFRWVALQIHELLFDRCLNTLELKNRLNSLPKGLDEAYTKIVQRSTRRADVILLLQWIIFGQEDFTARQLAEVASINFDGGDNILPFYDPDRRYGSPDNVLRACSGLVIEVEGANAFEQVITVHIKIAHFSVKEFLLSKVIQLGPTQSIHFNESISHLAIAKTCLAYLLQFSEPDSITHNNVNSFPLAFYAAERCVSHTGAIRGEDMDATLKQMIQQLALPIVSVALVNWSRLRDNRQNFDGTVTFKSPVELWDVTPCLYGTIMIHLTELVEHLVNNGNCGITLLLASDPGSLAIAQLLLEKGADVNATGGEYGTALQAASYRGLFEIAQLLLERGANVNARGGKYCTALQAASYGEEFKIVKLLLEKGADVNATGEEHGTALQAASHRGHLEIARLLLDQGADMNASGGEYGTALQAASYRGHLEISRLLLENGADMNATGGQYGTALQAASYQGEFRIANLLLEEGVDVNATGSHDGTALQAASLYGSVETVQLLLEKGADVNATGGQYGTALHAASCTGRLEICTLLLEKGADPNAVGGEYGTALQAASCGGHLDIAQLLLEKDANPDATIEWYGTALQAASYRGHLEMAQLLLDKGANVNAGEGEYGPVLQAASYGGKLEISKLLLENGADLDATGGWYGSALQAASYLGHLDITKLLLANGTDVNATGGEYGTALQAASIRGDSDIIKLLLESGADVNVMGGRYSTALQAASHRGHVEVALLLLENGADVNATGGQYGTALRAASHQGFLGLVRLLLGKGANINAMGGEYGTALQAASHREEFEIVELLLEKGAEVNATGGKCGTALQAARATHKERQVEAIVQLLIAHGAVET
ncbi:hypothetical protein HWV62_31716 [Athelia sp. TMB]|nr:hypothetical protein HWV62_31716 [Athelia sp. TMB]